MGKFGKVPQPLRAGRVAELAREANKLSPAGWDTVSAAAPHVLVEPRGRSAVDPEMHASTWDVLASGTFEPQVTFRDLTEHWYEGRPGGIDAAIENSQRAIRSDGIPYPIGHESELYGHWKPIDADTAMDVRVAPLPNVAGGSYSSPLTPASKGAITVSPLTASADHALSHRNAILEHEATHGLTLHGLSRSGWGQQWSAPYHHLPFNSDEFSELRDLLEPRVEYLMRRAEVDPRLAEIRRRYAALENKDVNTVGDAAEAWEWWRRNRQRFTFGGDQPATTMDLSAFDLYDSLPDRDKQILFRRMMQVPTVAAPIAAGSLLDGLRDSREQSR